MDLNDRKFLLDAIGMIVGLIIYISLATLMVYWADNKGDYYQNNPDFIPGTYIMIGILLLFPLLVYSFVIFTRGVGVVLWELIKSYNERTSQQTAEQ